MAAFKSLAQFRCAVHGQRRLLAVQKNFQVRTFTELKSRALLFQPFFHLLRVHNADNKHMCFFSRFDTALGYMKVRLVGGAL